MVTIDELFDLAIAKGASDLHLVAGQPPILRINGALTTQADLPVLSGEDTATICASILSADQQRLYIEKRDLDISYSTHNATLARARVNLHWERDNAGMVARIIPAEIPKLADLRSPGIIQDLLRLRRGLILVTGPTGCGKSTSLAAMVDFINEDRSENIITLEDPIEFLHTSKKSIIRQRQLGTDVLSFAEGLKHVVREDPNVVMVGEMRDLETIGAAITLAETGHLVLATLHTSDAIQTINRIIDVFPPYQQNQIRLQLSFFLKAVVSKRLLPGVSGTRVPVYEVLLNNPAVSTVIRENRIGQIMTIMQTSARAGMITMEKEMEKVLQEGLISRETLEAFGTSFDGPTHE